MKGKFIKENVAKLFDEDTYILKKLVRDLRKRYKDFLIWRGYGPDLIPLYAEEINIDSEGKILYGEIDYSGWKHHPLKDLLYYSSPLAKRAYDELMDLAKQKGLI
jgi:hypothetical protein